MPVSAPDFQIEKSGTILGYGWDEKLIEELPYPLLPFDIGRKTFEERVTHFYFFSGDPTAFLIIIMLSLIHI